MDEQLRTEFNEWARAGKGESMERGHRPVGEQAIAKMNVPPDALVLDVGCGSGWATRLLADYAFEGRVTASISLMRWLSWHAHLHRLMRTPITKLPAPRSFHSQTASSP